MDKRAWIDKQSKLSLGAVSKTSSLTSCNSSRAAKFLTAKSHPFPMNIDSNIAVKITGSNTIYHIAYILPFPLKDAVHSNFAPFTTFCSSNDLYRINFRAVSLFNNTIPFDPN